jgi:hypothetical protein
MTSVDQSIQPSHLLLFGFHICEPATTKAKQGPVAVASSISLFVVCGSWQEKLLLNYIPPPSSAYCYTLNMKALHSFKMS